MLPLLSGVTMRATKKSRRHTSSVNALREQVQFEELVTVQVVRQTPASAVAILYMTLQYLPKVNVPRTAYRECQMLAVARERKGLELLDIARSDRLYAQIRSTSDNENVREHTL
jgi:hypothetical protein